jgi:hypothetical protein
LAQIRISFARARRLAWVKAGTFISSILLWLPLLAGAAPNEIKVFTDELASYGEHTLETHANKASRAGLGAANSGAPLQIMPEYSYGIWRNWEISFQLPVATDHDHVRTNGYRSELQYVVPHDEDRGLYWGINVEVANLARNGERRAWNVELVPIVGLRVDRWHFVGNPGVSRLLTGPERKINFEPAAKAAYRVEGKNYLGLEYYLEAGPFRQWLPVSQRSQVLYVVWDGKISKSEINVGIGRGLSYASDRWVLKTVIEFSF